MLRISFWQSLDQMPHGGRLGMSRVSALVFWAFKHLLACCKFLGVTPFPVLPHPPSKSHFKLDHSRLALYKLRDQARYNFELRMKPCQNPSLKLQVQALHSRTNVRNQKCLSGWKQPWWPWVNSRSRGLNFWALPSVAIRLNSYTS